MEIKMEHAFTLFYLNAVILIFISLCQSRSHSIMAHAVIGDQVQVDLFHCIYLHVLHFQTCLQLVPQHFSK